MHCLQHQGLLATAKPTEKLAHKAANSAGKKYQYPRYRPLKKQTLKMRDIENS